MALLLCLAFTISAAATTPSSHHPFASHFLAIQISSSNEVRLSHTLSVANNMLKHYGPDNIAIEVVAFGPGIRLVYADSPKRKAVESLIAQGVRFDACGNTLDTIERKSGKRPKLAPGVVEVQTGVARLLKLHEKGYFVIQP